MNRRKCPSKPQDKPNVFKHFDPNFEVVVVPTDLPKVLPEEDSELLYPKKTCRRNKQRLCPQKKVTEKSATETQLIKPTVCTMSNKRKDSFLSKTDPSALHSSERFPRSTKFSRITPSVVTDEVDSRISHNIESIKQQRDCRMSLRDDSNTSCSNSEPGKKCKKYGYAKNAATCILQRLDTCGKAKCGPMEPKHVQNLRDEIKSFGNNCKRNPNACGKELKILKQEIAEFRRCKDAKFCSIQQQLESLISLTSPPCKPALPPQEDCTKSTNDCAQKENAKPKLTKSEQQTFILFWGIR